ncbi:MAG: mobile mystery protein A [Gemmatimonadales bacterium]
MTRYATTLNRRHLDKRLAPFRALARAAPPRDGWIREVRRALGMSGRQLATRLGIAASGVTLLEARERRGAVTIETLRKCADALGCDLAYAFVPRSSLQSQLDQQINRYAENLVSRVSESMSLEGQATSAGFARDQLVETRREIEQRLPRDLWDEGGGRAR